MPLAKISKILTSTFGIKQKYAIQDGMFISPISKFVQRSITASVGWRKWNKKIYPTFSNDLIGRSIPELEQYLTENNIKVEISSEPLEAIINKPKVPDGSSLAYNDYRCLILDQEINKRVLLRYDLYLNNSLIVLAQEDFGYKNPYQF